MSSEKRGADNGARDLDARTRTRAIGAAQAKVFTESRLKRGYGEEALDGLLRRHNETTHDDPIRVVIDAVADHADNMAGPVLIVRGELLVWDEDVMAARSALESAAVEVAVADLVTPRVRRLVVKVDTSNAQSGSQLRAAAEVVRNAGLRVSANHVLPFSPWWFKADASPEPSPLILAPRPFDSAKGAGVNVAVIDTGLDDQASVRTDQWLADIVGDADPGSLGPTPNLGAAGGHGTFVAGIIRQVAPGCTVKVYRALDADGVGGEVQVAQAILKAAADGADVINLSLGGSTLFGDPPLAIEDALANIPQRVQVVAAAGNDGSFTPTWPAAFKRVVSVGALEYEMTPSPYSNRGPWVDVSTVGSGAVSTFVSGTEADGEVFAGDSPCAVWSGTSFAAPQVAGLLAVLLADGIEPLSAVPALLAVGQPRPNFGSALRILDW